MEASFIVVYWIKKKKIVLPFLIRAIHLGEGVLVCFLFCFVFICCSEPEHSYLRLNLIEASLYVALINCLRQRTVFRFQNTAWSCYPYICFIRNKLKEDPETARNILFYVNHTFCKRKMAKIKSLELWCSASLTWWKFCISLFLDILATQWLEGDECSFC